MRDVTTEHKKMMDAALARDAGRATKLLAEHFWQTTNIILQGDCATPRGKPFKSAAAAARAMHCAKFQIFISIPP